MTAEHTRRITILFVLFCLIYTILIINLYRLQIYDHDFYVNIGTQQYHIQLNQLPPRAPIFDRSGTHYLAMNKESIAAFILPNHLTNPETLEPFLQRHFGRAAQQWRTKKNRSFMYIARTLSPEQLELLKHTAHPDIQLLHEPSRYYPLACAGPLIGLTDIDNRGIMGIEFYYDERLTGTPTVYNLEKDARSGYFYFAKTSCVAGQESRPLHLTIDSSLQFLAHEALNACIKEYDAQEGGVIIMNPDNGDILAMSCSPHFDPNSMHIRDMQETKNKPIANTYEMGSVMKVFTALAALQEGVVTADELIDCKNTKTTYLDGRRINTVKAHGTIPFWQVVACSNNIGIAIVAKRLQEKLYTHYTALGFGQKTGVPLPGQAKGFVNAPSNWSKQSIISLSYGYEVRITLLQLAAAFCLIAHNGCPVTPRINLEDPIHIGPQLYDDHNITTIKNILEQTTMHGTAQRARIKGYTIMSKTGTANMLVNGVYAPEKNIFTCTGIVQKGSYQRVIAVYVKEAAQKDLYASTVAAPLFEQIAQRLIVHDRIIM